MSNNKTELASGVCFLVSVSVMFLNRFYFYLFLIKYWPEYQHLIDGLQIGLKPREKQINTQLERRGFISIYTSIFVRQPFSNTNPFLLTIA